MDEILQQLVNQLGTHPGQTEVGAGALLNLIREHASQAEFGQLLRAVPEASKWMRTAPAPQPGGARGGAGSGGARGGAATQGRAKLRWPFRPTARTAKYSLSVLVFSSTAWPGRSTFRRTCQRASVVSRWSSSNPWRSGSSSASMSIFADGVTAPERTAPFGGAGAAASSPRRSWSSAATSTTNGKSMYCIRSP